MRGWAAIGGRWLATFVTLAALLLGSACTPFVGHPDRVTSRTTDLATLQPVIDANKIIACLQPTTPADTTCRNQLAGARMYAIDLQFSAFEERMFTETRGLGFATTLATLGLTTAGAVTAGAAPILSAAAAGLTGARAAFEKEVLAEQTLIAIHTAMRANRAEVGFRLRQGMGQSLADYPVGVALSDLEAYYQAGTVLGALVGITKAVGVEAQRAEQQLTALSTFSTDSAADFLSRFLVDPTVPLPERQQRELLVRRAYRELGVMQAETSFGEILIRDTSLSEQTRRVARTFGWQDN